MLRVSIDPGSGKITGKHFRFLSGLEAIHKSAQAVRVAPAIALPGDLGTRAPLPGALIERGIGDDQTITVI